MLPSIPSVDRGNRGQQLDIFLYRVLRSLREHRNLQNAVFCEESLGKNYVLYVYLAYEGVDQKPVMEVKFMLDLFSRDITNVLCRSLITKKLSKEL